MSILRVVPVLLLPREPDEARALRSANGADLQAEHSTRIAVVGFFGALAALLFSALLAGCSPADWAAVDAAGRVAKVTSCAICNSGGGAVDQAAEHARALREIFDAIGDLAAARDPVTVARIRAELAASQARERALAEQLLELAGTPPPAPSTAPSGSAGTASPDALSAPPPPSSDPGAP